MKSCVQIEFWNIQENEEYKKIVEKVARTCFEEEKLLDTNLYLNVILTNPEIIRQTNAKYRNIDKETDVLSFPMFQKEEIDKILESGKEYEEPVERELSYMIVHGFYHVMGYDHIKEEDKAIMRPKEEHILNKLNITRQ